MKNIFLFIVLLSTTFIFTSVTKSQDDRWILLSSKTDNNNIYISAYYDKETIEREYNSVLVWVKIEYNPSKYNKEKDKYLEKTLNRVKLYCGDRKIQYLEGDSYFTDSSISSTSFDNTDIENIVPESLGELLRTALCK